VHESYGIGTGSIPVFLSSSVQLFGSLISLIDLPPVFVPVFKLELNPIPKCFVSTEAVESSTARQPQVPGVNH
jgi:hypothetical protein